MENVWKRYGFYTYAGLGRDRVLNGDPAGRFIIRFASGGGILGKKKPKKTKEKPRCGERGFLVLVSREV